MDNLKRPRSEDGPQDDGRNSKHLRRTKPTDDPDDLTFNDLLENSSPYDSIRKWIHDVKISNTADIDMANFNPEGASADLHEDPVVEQLETLFTIQETPSERPGSPVKRKFGFASQNGPPLASYGNLAIRRLADPISRFVPTKQIKSSSSISEKQSTRSQSRNSSQDKQSVSARTTVSQGSTSVPMRRADMVKSCPAFVFCHTHHLASGTIPQTVLSFKKHLLPENLSEGILPSSSQESLVVQFPDAEFPISLFSDSPKYGIDIVDHVTSYYEIGLRKYRDNVGESAWSDMAKNLLRGLSKERREVLEVTGVENYNLHPGILPMKTPPLRSDIVIQINQLYDSKFGQLCRRAKFRPVEIDETFSPFARPGLKDTPAFAVSEIKAGGGNLLEAQMQAAVVGGAILLKARQIGASADVVPCVPAVIAIGSNWYLHLVYDEPDLIVTSTPWPIGDTITFLGTLKVVLFIERLRSYAKDTWWKLFVDGSCSDLLERCLGV
ncbi:uncharacterized protein DFL_000007 [Arthrobotrys flagrans]|uniref:PD-(D/E)XK nuclease-like domain-containing protein n=1 Tax=Arthrobotrys flagrans TaxID=97331 RepID=A0A437ACJ5_ARTFL|nr:hypothetical protein DFL_000007 [Arthrobotrys flagrans]